MSNSVVIRLGRAGALAAWRAADPDTQGKRDPEIIGHHRELLATGETIKDEDGQFILTLTRGTES